MDHNLRDKTVVTGCMWFLLVVAVVTLAVIADGNAVPIAFILTIPMFLISGMMWQWGQTSEQITNNTDSEQKRKREQIDAVLRDLSDEQLQALRQRLSDMDDDQLGDMLGNDGELIDWQNRQSR